jgi:3-hydroxybutyrate dehydrogenase
MAPTSRLNVPDLWTKIGRRVWERASQGIRDLKLLKIRVIVKPLGRIQAKIPNLHCRPRRLICLRNRLAAKKMFSDVRAVSLASLLGESCRKPHLENVRLPPNVRFAGDSTATAGLRHYTSSPGRKEKELSRDVNLRGRTALVTGSTSGIGLGIAHALAQSGCDLFLNGFGEPAAIESLRRLIAEQHQVRVGYFDADVSKPAECRDLIASAQAEAGKLDILVNNAGIQYVAPIEEFPQEQWDAVLAVNLSSAFHLIAATLPAMRAQKFGRILNIASVHGLVGSIHKSAYVAAKHGLVGLTKVVALETAGLGITCNAICPGWVLTPLLQHQIDAKAEAAGVDPEKAAQELLAEKQPSGVFTTSEQIGALVVFLSSQAADNITGACIPVDGGWLAQ